MENESLTEMYDTASCLTVSVLVMDFSPIPAVTRISVSLYDSVELGSAVSLRPSSVFSIFNQSFVSFSNHHSSWLVCAGTIMTDSP